MKYTFPEMISRKRHGHNGGITVLESNDVIMKTKRCMKKGIRMELLANERVTIHQHADKIFEYISNMETFPEWFQGALIIESLDDADHGLIGKSYVETVKVPLVGAKKIQLTVVESEKPVRFVTEGQFPPLLPRMEITIRAKGHSSDVTWKMYSRNTNVLFKALLLPLAKAEVAKRATVSLAQLKERLEHTM